MVINPKTILLKEKLISWNKK